MGVPAAEGPLEREPRVQQPALPHEGLQRQRCGWAARAVLPFLAGLV
jgi:hypothetical protein